jgi:Domain of unknown function (DUF4326)
VTRRVKVAGDLFHGRVPAGAVYIGRGSPGLPRSVYANPYPVKAHGLAESLRLYTEHLDRHPHLVARARVELGDSDVACWCKLPAAGEPDLCHGAVLLEVIHG